MAFLAGLELPQPALIDRYVSGAELSVVVLNNERWELFETAP